MQLSAKVLASISSVVKKKKHLKTRILPLHDNFPLSQLENGKLTGTYDCWASLIQHFQVFCRNGSQDALQK